MTTEPRPPRVIVSARGRNDGGMDSDVVQLRTGSRLVTDISQQVIQFCRDRGDGLCHVSELDTGYVQRPEDVVQIGDRVQVKVIAIDDQDRVKLSRKAALREQSPQPAGN